MKLARDFIVYGVTGALSRLGSLLLVPIYTRAFSLSEYGELEVLLAILMLIVLGIGLQAESALVRDYFRARKEGWLKKLIWGAATISACGALVVGLVLIFAVQIDMPQYIRDLLPLLLAAGIASNIFALQLIVIRYADRPILFGVLSIGDILATGAFSILFILVMGMGVEGAILGLLASKAFGILIAWPLSFRLPPGTDGLPGVIRGMLAYSVPTMPAVLLNWVQTIGTRVIWTFFLPLAAVGISGLGLRVASLFALLTYSFRLAWEPVAFRTMEEEEGAQDYFEKMFEFISFIALLAASGAVIVGPLAVAIFAPPDYWPATGLVGTFVMTHIWLIVALVAQMGIHAARATYLISVVYALAAALNLAILAALADVLGAYTTAVALFASAVVTAVASCIFSNRKYATRHTLRAQSALLVSTAGLSVVSWLYPAWQQSLLPHPATVAAIAASLVFFWLVGISPNRRGEAVRHVRSAVRILSDRAKQKR